MIKLIENDMNKELYLSLRKEVGWVALTDAQAEAAIAHSLFFVRAVEEETGQTLGMGRIVGDGAVICYIQDLVVIPSAQGRGVGSLLIRRLMDWVESIRMPESRMMLCLMCAKGREAFYQKHGFLARPTEGLGPGMIIYLS